MYSQSCVRGGFSILSTCVDERTSTTANNVTVLRTHRLTHTHPTKSTYRYNLYYNGHKVTVCHAPLPAQCSLHISCLTLACLVVPDGMKRSCSSDEKCLLSGLISDRLLYGSPLVCTPTRASGCRRMMGPTCGAVVGDSFMKHAPPLAHSLSGSPPLCFDEMQSEPGRGHEQHVHAHCGCSYMQKGKERIPKRS